MALHDAQRMEHRWRIDVDATGQVRALQSPAGARAHGPLRARPWACRRPGIAAGRCLGLAIAQIGAWYRRLDIAARLPRGFAYGVVAMLGPAALLRRMPGTGLSCGVVPVACHRALPAPRRRALHGLHALRRVDTLRTRHRHGDVSSGVRRLRRVVGRATGQTCGHLYTSERRRCSPHGSMGTVRRPRAGARAPDTDAAAQWPLHSAASSGSDSLGARGDIDEPPLRRAPTVMCGRTPRASTRPNAGLDACRSLRCRSGAASRAKSPMAALRRPVSRRRSAGASDAARPPWGATQSRPKIAPASAGELARGAGTLARSAHRRSTRLGDRMDDRDGHARRGKIPACQPSGSRAGSVVGTHSTTPGEHEARALARAGARVAARGHGALRLALVAAGRIHARQGLLRVESTDRPPRRTRRTATSRPDAQWHLYFNSGQVVVGYGFIEHKQARLAACGDFTHTTGATSLRLTTSCTTCRAPYVFFRPRTNKVLAVIVALARDAVDSSLTRGRFQSWSVTPSINPRSALKRLPGGSGSEGRARTVCDRSMVNR